MGSQNEIETTTPNGGVKYWLNELDEAKKRDQDYHKEGKRIIDIYECKDAAKVPFNILFSNTDTILPALYSAIPRPVIKQRYKNEDATAQAAATAGERLLTYLLDTNTDGYETFNDGIENSVIDALLPGRGVTRIKYDAEIVEPEITKEPIDSDQTGDDVEPEMTKESELVCVDSICWDKVFFGYAKKWSKVPWVAFEEIIDKDEAVRLFGKETANKINFVKEGGDDDEAHKENEHQGGRKTAVIYQIWDKDGGRKVRYVSKHYKDDYLKVDDDPLELTGFYPMPQPLTLIAKSNNMTATAPYSVYEEQAKELNEVTRRRTRVLKAIKAKGIYDAELGGDIENLMDGDDNTLIPADKSAVLSEKGFENSIWFMPIEQLIRVYMELTNAQNNIKQIIYEITGISDIIRGSTVASETATAQNIKSQWGTMRLKRNQGEIQRYARDMMRLMLEIAASKFSEETWAAMTGLDYSTDQQVAQAQQIMQAAQQIQQQLAMQPQQIGQDGQPQQPQIPPQAMQAYQQAQQTLQQPQWSAVLDLLKNDMQRSYRIDIETNSTIIPEATEDKQNMNEALTALSTFVEKSLPVVQAGLLPFEGFKAILLKISRQFQFGEEIQDELKGMQAPPPPAAPVDNSMQIKQMELQAKQASDQMKAQADAAKVQSDKETAQGQAMLQANIEKMHQQDVQGQAMLDVQLEKMRLENDKLLEIMRIASAEKTAKYQSDLDARTKIELVTMQNQCAIKQAAINANTNINEDAVNDFDNDGNLQPKQSIMDKMLVAITEMNQRTEDQLKSAIEAMALIQSAPKNVIRDMQGRPVGIESAFQTQTIVRNSDGNIIRIQ